MVGIRGHLSRDFDCGSSASFDRSAREPAGRNAMVRDYRRVVSASHTNLGEVLRSVGRMAAARADYDRAIALTDAPVREVPEATLSRSELARALRLRGRVRRELGDPAGAGAL